MHKDELDGLIALKLVAEKKSFSGAAEALSVSSPAISQIIKQLESRVGVALLHRTTRSTSLTEVGRQFLNQAGPAIEQILSALHNVGTYAEKPSGLLRLNVPRAVYPTFLQPIVLSFIKKYPEVCVEVFFEDQASDMVKGEFDAGIRISDILDEDMVALKLFGPLHFVVAASPKYWNKKGRPKHPKDLLTHDCLRARFGNAGLYDNWEFEQKGKEFQVKVKGPLILNDGLAAREAALAGVGVVYGIEDLMADDIASGKLEVVLRSFAASSAGFYLYYPKRSQVQPKLRAFIEHIKSQD
jgi:DNA-binding transcriptional LysR family regulator